MNKGNAMKQVGNKLGGKRCGIREHSTQHMAAIVETFGTVDQWSALQCDFAYIFTDRRVAQNPPHRHGEY